MLVTLRIRNLALVTDLTLELPAGLVAITGETGAGKSVILGALNLVLGERADRTLIRSGEEQCTVEAVFDLARGGAGVARVLERHGLEAGADGQLFLKRTLTAAGVNRQFVNGAPTTLGVLAEVGEGLVDMHGPHDHQSLLRPARQLAIVDAYGGLEGMVGEYGKLVGRWGALRAEKAGLIQDERTYARQLELVRFQTQEIEQARLQPGEDVGLEEEYERAHQAGRLLQLGQAALDALTEAEPSVTTQAGVVGRLLGELRRIDARAEVLTGLQAQAMAGLQELQRALADYLDRVEVDPAQLRALEERLNLVQALKRKYGGSVAAILEFGVAARRRLGQLEARDAEVARLNAELEQVSAALTRAGRALTARRQEVLPRLAGAVSAQLRDLGFARSQFEIQLESRPAPNASEAGDGTAVSPPASGWDAVEFLFAPNPGEPARPLRAIASSGEMARVMLALKTVLAALDEIPVLVFDEVDANVGGPTAAVVGAKMRLLARRRQVLCLTHLAPVAAMAGAHFLVSKQAQGGRTVTTIAPLTAAERVTELARMLGGQGEVARRHAAALLREAGG